MLFLCRRKPGQERRRTDEELLQVCSRTFCRKTPSLQDSAHAELICRNTHQAGASPGPTLVLDDERSVSDSWKIFYLLMLFSWKLVCLSVSLMGNSLSLDTWVMKTSLSLSISLMGSSLSLNIILMRKSLSVGISLGGNSLSVSISLMKANFSLEILVPWNLVFSKYQSHEISFMKRVHFSALVSWKTS